jgi:hypothetical protein
MLLFCSSGRKCLRDELIVIRKWLIDMMIEANDVKQAGSDVRRRWFSDDYFDLIVWENKNKDILGFELCYGKNKDEHAFVWTKQDGHSHLMVDDGESVSGRFKMAPVMMADGHFDAKSIASKFLEVSRAVDQKVSNFVYGKLRDYIKNHVQG